MPSDTSSNLEDGDPSQADVVKGNCSLEGVLITGVTNGVILVPVDARGVGGGVVLERFCRAVTLDALELEPG